MLHAEQHRYEHSRSCQPLHKLPEGPPAASACALRDMTWIRGQDNRHVLPLGGSRPAATSAHAMLGALQCFYPGWVFAVLSGHALSILLLLRYSPLAGQEQVRSGTSPEHTANLQHASTCCSTSTTTTTTMMIIMIIISVIIIIIISVEPQPAVTLILNLNPRVRHRCGRS